MPSSPDSGSTEVPSATAPGAGVLWLDPAGDRAAPPGQQPAEGVNDTIYRRQDLGRITLTVLFIAGLLVTSSWIMLPFLPARTVPIRARCLRAVSITPQALALMTAVTPPDWA